MKKVLWMSMKLYTSVENKRKFNIIKYYCSNNDTSKLLMIHHSGHSFVDVVYWYHLNSETKWMCEARITISKCVNFNFLEIPFDSVGLFLNHGSNPGQISFHQWLTWVIPLNSSLLKLPTVTSPNFSTHTDITGLFLQCSDILGCTTGRISRLENLAPETVRGHGLTWSDLQKKICQLNKNWMQQ